MRFPGSTNSQKIKNSYLAVSHDTSPNISTYPWSPSGFGTKYADPASLPNTGTRGVNFSRQGNYLGFTRFIGGAVGSFYNWSSAGFGSAISSDIRGYYSMEFSPDDKNIVTNDNSSPYIYVYPWSSSGSGTKYADPATLPGSDGSYVAWSNTGQGLVMSLRTNPFINGWAWSNGFGTKFAQPTLLPGTSSLAVSFSAFDNSKFAFAGYFPIVYPYSDSEGFGTRQINQSVAFLRGISFHPSTNYVAYTTSPNTYVGAMRYTGSGFGTTFSTPSPVPSGQAQNQGGKQITFSQNGYQVATAHPNSPYVTAYSWDDSGFGSKFSDPSTAPTGAAYGVAILN
jgi:hypothetical protein